MSGRMAWNPQAELQQLVFSPDAEARNDASHRSKSTKSTSVIPYQEKNRQRPTETNLREGRELNRNQAGEQSEESASSEIDFHSLSRNLAISCHCQISRDGQIIFQFSPCSRLAVFWPELSVTAVNFDFGNEGACLRYRFYGALDQADHNAEPEAMEPD